jgi:kynurenine formamidase
MNLTDIYNIIKEKEFVDLTHSFGPDIPHYPDLPNMEKENLFTVENDGFWVEKMTLVGQWGTHVDSPRHFANGLRKLDEIDVKEMFLPFVVIDISKKVKNDSDYCLSLEDVKEWESIHGLVPNGCFVALRSDWYKRWPDADLIDNKDEAGIAHYPGYSIESLKYLYETRKITASGHETPDTDCGIVSSSGELPCEYYVLSTNHYQIEFMANLDKVPPTGALIVATFPKLKDGSGFPARCFAILP